LGGGGESPAKNPKLKDLKVLGCILTGESTPNLKKVPDLGCKIRENESPT